jgi:hypothetical protein
MAATKTVPTKLQQEQTRAAIRTTQLVKRLQAFALGEREPNSSDESDPIVELDANRIKAIDILLKKALPDLAQVAHTDADGNALNLTFTIGGNDKTD